MKIKRGVFILFLCSIAVSAAPPTFRPVLQIKKVSDLDHKNIIDDPVWNNVPSHRFLKLIYTTMDIRRLPQEQASVKYLYDSKYFYIRADMIDSDIMTTAKKDGGHFYQQGDLLEVFIKPANANYYWEIYGTPNNLQTRFYFTSRSTVGLPSSFTHQDVGIKVYSKVNGTFNDPSDRDHSCITVVAVPLSELNRPHITKSHPAGTVLFAPGEEWLIFSSRYNASRYMPEQELSCFPQAFGGYHATEYYAKMEILK